MTWTFPTMASDGRAPHEPVKCGCCRRTTRADLFTDLTGVSGETRAAWQVPPGVNAICDACRETMLREGRATLGDMVESLGAPSEVSEMVRAKTEPADELEGA